eukprot:6175868-Pleurochrysis_carterae.AAC.2
MLARRRACHYRTCHDIHATTVHTTTVHATTSHASTVHVAALEERASGTKAEISLFGAARVTCQRACLAMLCSDNMVAGIAFLQECQGTQASPPSH